MESIPQIAELPRRGAGGAQFAPGPQGLSGIINEDFYSLSTGSALKLVLSQSNGRDGKHLLQIKFEGTGIQGGPGTGKRGKTAVGTTTFLLRMPWILEPLQRSRIK